MRFAYLILACAFFLINADALADGGGDSTGRLEHQDQPYAPGNGPTPHGPPAGGPPPGSVQVNVDANGMNIGGDAANSPSIAIDPTNPQRMVIGWRQFNTIQTSFRQAGYAYTTNGGASWTFPGVLTPEVPRTHPVLCADNIGRFYYASQSENLCYSVFQSTDAGMTWSPPVSAFGGVRGWMSVDRTNGGGQGFLYLTWQTTTCPGTGSLNQFTRSIDHGATWMTPISIPTRPVHGQVAVGPDGAVFVAGHANFTNLVSVSKSSNAQNGGVTPTWDFSIQGNYLGGGLAVAGFPNPDGSLGQVGISVSLLNPSHVFLLCSVNPPGSDPLDVMFSRSTNGGQTWNAPVRVNDDAVTTNSWQWFGTMSVAPNGRIDAVWNDTRDDASANTSKTRYSYSLDEGITWNPSYAFTPAWDSHVGYPDILKIGDYYHMISDNDAAHLAYSATFNGEQDVYYTRIVPNDCNRNGIADNLDIANSTSTDCNSNGLPDDCENDCNQDQIADVCALAGNDCNANSIPDDCEAGHEDCNDNGVFDLCEGYVDCNGNGHWDLCDIASGAGDCDADGIPNVCELPGAPLATNACANAVFVSPGVVNSGTTVSATTDSGSAASCAASGRDVYFKYRPSSTGLLRLSLCTGTSFDSVLTVHTGCPATAANQLSAACNDDGCGTGSGASIINNVPVTVGTTYVIRLAGFTANGYTWSGNYTLTLTGPIGVGDCNGNGIPDDCEMTAGADANANGIPDTCEFPGCLTCPGDLDGNATINGGDIAAFTTCFLAFPPPLSGCGCADLDYDHNFDTVDVNLFVAHLIAGLCP